MGNCASEPKTKGDDRVPAPEPRKEEDVDVDIEQEQNKPIHKQPSLGALLVKEDEEKIAELVLSAKSADEEKPKTAEKEEEMVTAAVETEKASEASPTAVNQGVLDKKSEHEETKPKEIEEENMITC